MEKVASQISGRGRLRAEMQRTMGSMSDRRLVQSLQCVVKLSPKSEVLWTMKNSCSIRSKNHRFVEFCTIWK
jgi:hypothetical protein